METLLDDYKRKLQTAEKMIREYEEDMRLMNTETLVRVTTKAAEYRCFIVDIERAMARLSTELSNCNKPAVSKSEDVERRELLFAFIQEIKDEFKDKNWDYFYFIAERVLSK